MGQTMRNSFHNSSIQIDNAHSGVSTYQGLYNLKVKLNYFSSARSQEISCDLREKMPNCQLGP